MHRCSPHVKRMGIIALGHVMHAGLTFTVIASFIPLNDVVVDQAVTQALEALTLRLLGKEDPPVHNPNKKGI